MRMKYLLLIIGLFVYSTGFSQDLTINGKVLDGAFDNQPLAFANVKVKDLDISVETDIDGSYQLNLLKGSYTLVVDFIGYESIEIENILVLESSINLSPVFLQATNLETDALLASKE